MSKVEMFSHWFKLRERNQVDKTMQAPEFQSFINVYELYLMNKVNFHELASDDFFGDEDMLCLSNAIKLINTKDL